MRIPNLLNASQRFFDLLIIVGALLLAIGVWFIPSFSNSKEFKEFVKANNERKAERLELEADARARAEENERTGAVYIIPLTPEGEHVETPQTAPQQ
ncbi:MAG: hypothetical protein R3C52_02385 [Hyphomonadaceae bacterium]